MPDDSTMPARFGRRRCGAIATPRRSTSIWQRSRKRPATWKPRGATSRPPSNSRRKRLATRASCSSSRNASGVQRLDVDLDLLRLRLFELRDLDLQHAVDVIRGDVVRVDAARQRERADEAAVRALDAVIVAVVLPLELALAADGEHAVLEGDLEVVLVHAGDLDLDHDLVGLLSDVDRGRP